MSEEIEKLKAAARAAGAEAEAAVWDAYQQAKAKAQEQAK